METQKLTEALANLSEALEGSRATLYLHTNESALLSLGRRERPTVAHHDGVLRITHAAKLDIGNLSVTILLSRPATGSDFEMLLGGGQ